MHWLIGGAVLTFAAMVLDDIEKSSKKKKKKKLKKKHKTYAVTIEKKHKYNREEKKKILFKQIKEEQSKLKQERRKLAQARNFSTRGSQSHRKLVEQIKTLSYLIDCKQNDADRVRL